MNQLQKNGEMPRGPWQETARFSLVFSLLVPVIIIIILRPYIANDAALLGVALIVPVVWVLVLYIRRRRVDWLGVTAAIGFAGALAASPFAAANALPLKIYHPAVTGVVGIMFLISVAVGRPMLWLFIKTYNIAGPGHLERLGNPEVKKKLSQRTVVVGLVFIVEAAAHIVLAWLALPTDTYLQISGAVSVAAALVLITVIRLAAKRSR